MANVAKLLHTTVDPETFLVNLTPEDTPLKDARTKIREHLRAAFASAGREVFGEAVRPRFFTQGSSAYGTLNDPAWPPTQQMDLDYGCYLPLSFVKGEKPSTAAKLFFKFVDAALKVLAESEGWRQEFKPTCCRVVISRDAHVDIPLYAIPDREFVTLQDRITKSATASLDAKYEDWSELPSDSVLLAHRDEDWKISDPRQIHKWFVDAVDLYGEKLRRDCRYMKGWRDHHELDEYKVSSILLMACIWNAYEAIRGPFLPDREDERLQKVVEYLPQMLKGPVFIPACGNEDLNRIPKEHRQKVADLVEGLASRLRDVVRYCEDQQDAVEEMRGMFGTRIPYRTDLVAILTPAAVTVTSQPKKVNPAPEVGRSTSG
ncbi:MAG: hypothetical protein EOR73_25640 [Mesorhizobium sp.]|nr:MAG: hypothetical protein EOR73_25640 [Mesorhizobium sp.]